MVTPIASGLGNWSPPLAHVNSFWITSDTDRMGQAPRALIGRMDKIRRAAVVQERTRCAPAGGTCSAGRRAGGPGLVRAACAPRRVGLRRPRAGRPRSPGSPEFPGRPSARSTPNTPEGPSAPASGSQALSMAFAAMQPARHPLSPALRRARLTTLTQASLALQTARSHPPCFAPGLSTTHEGIATGTQTSPRTGLTPAGRPELVAPLRHVDLPFFTVPEQSRRTAYKRDYSPSRRLRRQVLLERISHHGGDAAVLVFGSLDQLSAKLIGHAKSKLRGSGPRGGQRRPASPRTLWELAAMGHVLGKCDQGVIVAVGLVSIVSSPACRTTTGGPRGLAPRIRAVRRAGRRANSRCWRQPNGRARSARRRRRR